MTSRCLSRELASWFGAALLTAATLLGCAARSIEGGVGAGGQGAAATGGSSASGGGSLGLGGELMGDAMVSPYRCDGPELTCRKVNCPADGSPATTSVSGTVYDPAGRVPLYNAVVYVVEPTDLPTLGERAQCEKCSAHFPDGAVAVARTDANGRFLVPDMPTGTNVPLVIQLGKWRRQVTLEQDLKPCTNTELTGEQTRLPRNSTEGHIPKIAVTTGASDALECLLKKIGVDVDEFTPDTDDGRVNLFRGFGAAPTMMSRGQSVALTPAEDLWASSDRMLDYDMLLMACEGSDNLWNPGDTERPPAMHREVRKYADLGGRIFGSHWQHRWINSDNVTPDDQYPKVANFAKSAADIGAVTALIDATFPKGAAFQDWLYNVGASTTLGELLLEKAEHSVDSVISNVAQRWIYGTDPGGAPDDDRMADMVQYFSFTTPVGEAECGRMVFSDVHVSFGGGEYQMVPFPERCDASSKSELSAQEKALAFMIFDLSSCIQKERDEVPMPITVVK